MLYCICRKPYDQRAMIACDRCDEWYHFDCIKLRFPPKIYICPACEPRRQELLTLPMGDRERSAFDIYIYIYHLFEIVIVPKFRSHLLSFTRDVMGFSFQENSI